MPMTRFIQILLLRDVLMYFLPGVTFIALLSAVGFDGQISRCVSFARLNFGNLLGVSMGMGISYSTGYAIHNFMCIFVRRFFSSAASRSEAPQENQTAEEAVDSIPCFTDIAEDMERRVEQSLGRRLLSNWSHGIKEELRSDDRGVRYIRYLCEMMVMMEYPDIHHFTIERRSALKNFQVSLSGILIIAGVIGIAYYIVDSFTGQNVGGFSPIIGAAMVFLGVGMFLSVKKREQDLRISIWRGFHAMSLLEEYKKKTEGVQLNSHQEEPDAS